ncbi:hypothetical protein I7I48_05777 [Histoplasma ohiense]|nr:hypothetical protein I7I48_05777 [Histoplasma ohiense (nom. inval.)]
MQKGRSTRKNTYFALLTNASPIPRNTLSSIHSTWQKWVGKEEKAERRNRSRLPRRRRRNSMRMKLRSERSRKLTPKPRRSWRKRQRAEAR